MNWASDPEIAYCRRIKIVRDSGDIFVGERREKRILHASSCRYIAGDATFKTVMPETRRMGETELFLYNIICPAQSAGAANTKGSVQFPLVNTMEKCGVQVE